MLPGHQNVAGGYLNRHSSPHLELLSKWGDSRPFSVRLDRHVDFASHTDILALVKNNTGNNSVE